jgi:hypothetical protein
MRRGLMVGQMSGYGRLCDVGYQDAGIGRMGYDLGAGRRFSLVAKYGEDAGVCLEPIKEVSLLGIFLLKTGSLY